MTRLKILFVNMLYDYGDPRRGYGLELIAYDTLHRMGHQLVPFHYDVLMAEYGREKMNEMLLQTAIKEKPDCMFVSLSENQLDPEVIHQISFNTDTITFNWCADDHWRLGYTLAWAPHFNWMVTTSAAAVPVYHQAGYSNVIKSQWGCNPAIHQKLNLPKIYDVTFIGMPHGNRVEMLQALVDAGFNVHVWGAGWATGRVSIGEMVRIFNQTKINLNFSKASVADILQIKARDFEVPGCGGLLMTGYNDELSEYYEFGKEVVTYRDQSELIEKIRYYLTHEEERDRIAEAGYNRAVRDHSYNRRFDQIFREMGLYGSDRGGLG
ncbi:CgeB family protein [Effusibacillus consociatus]|uniref:Glycosyltransferase n=1 Tax=Effusibacillus consociatus TaxID=1117041 RepID=A0ABV9Q3M9_9BACL